MNSLKFYAVTLSLFVILFPNISNAQDEKSVTKGGINDVVIADTVTATPIVTSPVSVSSKSSPYSYGLTFSTGAVADVIGGWGYNRGQEKISSSISKLANGDRERKEITKRRESTFENDIFFGFSGFFIYKPTEYAAIYVDGGINFNSFLFNTRSWDETKIFVRSKNSDNEKDDTHHAHDEIKEQDDKNQKTKKHRYNIVEVNTNINARWYPYFFPKFYLFMGPSFIFNVYKKMVISEASSKISQNANVKNINIAFGGGIGCDLGVIFIEIFTAHNLLGMFTESIEADFKGHNISKIGGMRIGVDISKFIKS